MLYWKYLIKQLKKLNKLDGNWKRGSKTMPISKLYDCIYRKLKKINQKIVTKLVNH